MSLGRWQPDIICISLAKKKIAIGPEVSLPSARTPPTLGWRPSKRPIVGWTLLSPLRKVHGFGQRPASGEEGSLGSTISSPRERAGVHGD